MNFCFRVTDLPLTTPLKFLSKIAAKSPVLLTICEVNHVNTKLYIKQVCLKQLCLAGRFSHSKNIT